VERHDALAVAREFRNPNCAVGPMRRQMKRRRTYRRSVLERYSVKLRLVPALQIAGRILMPLSSSRFEDHGSLTRSFLNTGFKYRLPISGQT
jgi:hypothetical protein